VPVLRMDRPDDSRPVQGPAPKIGPGAVQLPGLRNPGRQESGGPPRPLPEVRSAQDERVPRKAGAPIPAPTAGAVCRGDLAVDVAFSGLKSGEGVRVGLLGDTGCGKSFAARLMVARYLRDCRGLAAVADSKGDGGWEGELYESVADLAEQPNKTRALVFTPDPLGEPLDLESIARWQWALAARHTENLVLYDEISDGCQDGEWLDGARALPRVFTHGRRVAISAIWGGQYAQMVPREPFECSSVIFCWRQAGNAIRVLRRRGYTDERVEAVIEALPGDESPPNQRGAFVMLRRGRPWDGRIYRF
jgi:hypothetical protein